MNELARQSIVWEPAEDLIRQSNLVAFMAEHGIEDYEALMRRAEEEPEWWWNAIAGRLRFMKPYDKIMDLSKGIEFAEWFIGGTTNIVENSLDRHRGTPVWTSPAVIGDSENGESRIWTYEELSAEVSRLASGLKSLGVKPGEVVAVYMPNVNEAVVALLAVPKIGAVVMPLFSGFGVDAILARLNASEAVAILTVDGATRRGQVAPMKEFADAAAARAPSVRNVICLRRTGHPVTMGETDIDWEELCEGQPTDMPNAEMPAEAPALLVYTSGTSGMPKGTVHTHGGFPAKLTLDLGLMMDMKSSDRIVWFSDMGWLVGPLLAFGATLMGASFVLADGAPDYPDATRMWRLIEKHHVTFLGVSPTLIRGFMHGAGVGDHDISSIRLVASTGEAWTPDAWWWTFENVLKSNAPIINYTGGTEIGGGILAGSVLRPMKPCSFSGPVPGMGADIVDMDGKPLGPGTVGELVLRKPSIGLSRGLWKDNERYLASYWRDIPGCWRQGDWAVRDEDGFWFVLGRSDDTLKIAGKRTGPSEIEALLTATGKVREVAAIGIPDEIKGESVACVVVLDKDAAAGATVEKELADAVIAGLGYPYKPKFILTVPDLPKTRNMKVMRRLVRAVCLGKPLGDTSSLVNPEALEAISEAAINRGHLTPAAKG
ncbi:MAG: AMP-dependent synthetase [Sneathiella sp.]|uniref:AMP-binding protein n=1 Tax=Sneathiella sp. TaxID=1964365 RepID=UPI000C64D1FF|nr:AMP-binding protein [Sneathiella sp.]MAL80419.1 AMP-dependent synthetase [Sneathiella sp.]